MAQIIGASPACTYGQLPGQRTVTLTTLLFRKTTATLLAGPGADVRTSPATIACLALPHRRYFPANRIQTSSIEDDGSRCARSTSCHAPGCAGGRPLLLVRPGGLLRPSPRQWFTVCFFVQVLVVATAGFRWHAAWSAQPARTASSTSGAWRTCLWRWPTLQDSSVFARLVLLLLL